MRGEVWRSLSRASCLWQRRGNNAIVPPEPVPSEPLRGDEGGVGAEPQKKKSESSKLSWRLLPIRFAQGRLWQHR